MEQVLKVQYFEYVLNRLLAWHSQSSGNVVNDFNILKSIKLLFFVSAAGGTRDSNPLIQTVFDKFVAMPYGHVESDVYDQIKINNGNLDYYQIDNNRTTERDAYNADQLDPAITAIIDLAIQHLQRVNPSLVKMSSFDLVNLSHAWYSWQKYYSMAKQQGQRSIRIPVEAIINEDKIYSLNSF